MSRFPAPPPGSRNRSPCSSEAIPTNRTGCRMERNPRPATLLPPPSPFDDRKGEVVDPDLEEPVHHVGDRLIFRLAVALEDHVAPGCLPLLLDRLAEAV